MRFRPKKQKRKKDFRSQICVASVSNVTSLFTMTFLQASRCLVMMRKTIIIFVFPSTKSSINTLLLGFILKRRITKITIHVHMLSQFYL